MSAENRSQPPERHPATNPFASAAREFQINQKTVKTRTTPRELMDPNAGDVGASVVHIIENVDEDHFVKALTDGVRSAFDLGDAGSDVFQIVLVEYQHARMANEHCDSLTLLFSDIQLNGNRIGMNQQHFQFGLEELLSKGLISPKEPNQYWLNQAIFCNSRGLILIQEYRLS